MTQDNTPGNASRGAGARLVLDRLRALKTWPPAAAAWGSLRRFSAVRHLAASLQQAAAPDAFRPKDIEILAENDAFAEARNAAQRIEGMFSDFSMAVVDSLLSFQDKAAIAGSMLEFGVYRGRSAALLGRHLRGDEKLILVDIIDYLDRAAIAPFRRSAELIVTPTEKFRDVFAGYDARRHSFRFIHIDASHNYRATFAELQMADELLASRGIIALDDFVNLDYSQNMAAIFKYLYTAPTDLTVFLVTNEKGYLCRKADFAFYVGFILGQFVAEMGSRGVPDCYLARTDVEPEYGPVHARTRLPGEQGHHYGLDVESYRNNFRSP
jgi:predicted O-methyltransferase YrrM